MKALQIATVGFPLPDEDIEYIEIESRASLLEFDVILFRPGFPEVSSYRQFNGLHWYEGSSSKRAVDSVNHWKHQLSEAIAAKRLVIIVLPYELQAYIETGRREFSGTGRNRQTTEILDRLSTYDAIPFPFGRVTAVGAKISPTGSFPTSHDVWSSVSNLFEYKMVISDDKLSPILNISNTNKAVSGVWRDTESFALLLPDFSINWMEAWFDQPEEATGAYWKQEALDAGERLRSFVEDIATALTESPSNEAPEWANSPEFLLSEEVFLSNSIERLEAKIATLQSEVSAANDERASHSRWRQLLFGTGKPLEKAVRRVFSLADIDVLNFTENDLEFDLLFEFEGTRFIGEVEGKDNKAISVDKISQLQRCISEDFSRDDVSEFAKGVLFGNAHRLLEPASRPPAFTEKVVKSAERSGIVLVETRNLYDVIQDPGAESRKKRIEDWLRMVASHPGGILKARP